MKRLIPALVAGILLIAVTWGCSSGKSSWGDKFYDEILNYEEQNVVTFNIAGTTICARCEESDDPVTGVMIEVTLKNDPTRMLGAKMFDGTGLFIVPNMRWQSGVALKLTAMIFSGVDKVLYTEHVDVTVPDEDGETVAVTINF